MLLAVGNGTSQAYTPPAGEADVLQLVEMIRTFFVVALIFFSMGFDLARRGVEEGSGHPLVLVGILS